MPEYTTVRKAMDGYGALIKQRDELAARVVAVRKLLDDVPVPVATWRDDVASLRRHLDAVKLHSLRYQLGNEPSAADALHTALELIEHGLRYVDEFMGDRP